MLGFVRGRARHAHIEEPDILCPSDSWEYVDACGIHLLGRCPFPWDQLDRCLVFSTHLDCLSRHYNFLKIEGIIGRQALEFEIVR